MLPPRDSESINDAAAATEGNNVTRAQTDKEATMFNS